MRDAREDVTEFAASSMGTSSSVAIVSAAVDLQGTLFKLPSGMMIHAEHLENGSIVLASSGALIEVMQAQRCNAGRGVNVVELTAAFACMTFTADHRAVMSDVQGRCTEFASELSCGDYVFFTSGMTEPLVSVRAFTMAIDLYRIAFSPDD